VTYTFGQCWDICIGPTLAFMRWTYFQNYIGPISIGEHLTNAKSRHWANVSPMLHGLVGGDWGKFMNELQ